MVNNIHAANWEKKKLSVLIEWTARDSLGSLSIDLFILLKVTLNRCKSLVF